MTPASLWASPDEALVGTVDNPPRSASESASEPTPPDAVARRSPECVGDATKTESRPTQSATPTSRANTLTVDCVGVRPDALPAALPYPLRASASERPPLPIGGRDPDAVATYGRRTTFTNHCDHRMSLPAFTKAAPDR